MRTGTGIAIAAGVGIGTGLLTWWLVSASKPAPPIIKPIRITPVEPIIVVPVPGSPIIVGP